MALLSSTRRIQSLRLTVEQAKTESANMKRRQELGLRTELEVIQARLALADERFKLQEEIRSRAAKAMSLSHLVRLPVAPDAELNADVAMDTRLRPLANYSRAALENHRALTRLARLLEQARHEQRRLDAADYPELELSTALTDFDGDDRSRSVALSLVYRFGGHRVQAERSETQGTFTAQDFTISGGDVVLDQSLTSFGITFFDFQDPAADQGSRQYQARYQRHQAARELVEAREAKLREIQRRYHTLQSAMARLKLEGMRVKTGTLERDAYQRAYQGGNVRYEEFLERQNLLNRNVLAEIDARGGVMLAWIGLLNESGLPLSK